MFKNLIYGVFSLFFYQTRRETDFKGEFLWKMFDYP